MHLTFMVQVHTDVVESTAQFLDGNRSHIQCPIGVYFLVVNATLSTI